MHELETIPAGRAGLARKVRKIRELVEAAKRKPEFRAKAAAIVADVAQKDHEGEVRAVFDFVRDRVRYLRDPWSPQGLELFTEPGRMLEDIGDGKAAGDCDDHVILASALLETIGYRTRYRIGGLPPDRYRHIWLEVEVPKLGWTPLELTGKDLPFGFDPSSRFPLTLTLYGDEMNEPQGLGRGWSASRSRIRYPRRMRQASLARGIAPHALQGDEAPESWWNAQVANASAPDWFGATPSDFLRAQAIREMAPETIFGEGLLSDYELAGDEPQVGLGSLKKLSKKLKKATKKITESAKKVTKKVAKATKKGTLQPFKIGKKLAKSTQKIVKQAGKLIASPFKKSSPGAPGDSISPEAAEEIGPPEVYTDPATSYEEGGYYNPEPAYDADSYGSDWTTSEEPYFEDPVPADDGSYVPLPDDWPPQESEEAFEDEDYGGGDFAPGFGQWGSAGSVFDDEEQEIDPMENTFGSLGAESWLTELGKQAANTVLQYQQARLASKAQQKGYGPLNFGPPQAPVTKQPPRPRSGSAALGSWGPIALVGIGGIVILSLMGGVRRRR